MNGASGFRIFRKFKDITLPAEEEVRGDLKKNEQIGLKTREIVIGILTYSVLETALDGVLQR